MSFEKPHITYCRIVAFSLIGLAILIVSIYSNSFHCSWHFDDIPNIVENPRLHMENIDWESFKKALFSDRNNPHFPYRPVACLSFALNYYFGKLNVFGYHVVNLGIHLITAIFLFLFIYRTLEYLALTKRWDGDTYFVALLSTVLWAINPIQTQAVTYIVQRMASMAAMLYIMGMYFYLRARTAQTSLATMASYALCLLSFVLALGSKENAAMFPVSIFLYEAVILQDDVVMFIKKSWKWILLALGITLLIGAFYFFFKTGKLIDLSGGYKGRLFTLSQRLLTEPRIIIYYISLIFYPMPNRLSLLRKFSVSTSFFSPFTTFFSILAIITLIGLAVVIVKKRPCISFAILFFLANHIVESTIFPLELYFEHRNYLPSMFAFIPLAMGLVTLFRVYKERISMKLILGIFIVAILVGFGHSTFMRNFAWKTEESLWLDAVQKAPTSPRAHHNLAKAYADIGETQKAINHYIIAIKLPRDTARTTAHLSYYNLALIYINKSDYSKASQYLRKAIEIRPNFANAYSTLSTIMAKRKRYLEAYKLALQGARYNPYSPEAHNSLGLILLQIKKYPKAISEFKKAFKLQPNRLTFIVNLSIAYKKAKDYSKALYYFRKALEKNPTEVFTTLHMADTYCLMKKPKLASYMIQRLCNGPHLFDLVDNLAQLCKKYPQYIMPKKSNIIPLIRKHLIMRAQELQDEASSISNLMPNDGGH